MTAFFCPPTFIPSSKKLSVTLTDSGFKSSVNLGDPSSDRIIMVMCSILDTRGAGEVQTGMTIAGVTATRAGAEFGIQVNLASFYALVPSGSTGSLTFAGGGAVLTRHVGVYRITGWLNPSPVSAGFGRGGGSAARSFSVATVDGCSVIGLSAGDSNGSSWSAGVRTYYNADGQGLIHTGCLVENVPSGGISVTNSNNRAVGGISWR